MSATVTCAWCDKSGHPDSHWTFDEDVALWFCCGECCSSHADEQDYDKLRARAEKAEARVKELEARAKKAESWVETYKGAAATSMTLAKELGEKLDAARKLCGEAAEMVRMLCDEIEADPDYPCGCEADVLFKRLRKFAEGER